MAYRTFLDSTGAYWQAWDVQPTKIERRHTDRRHPLASRWQGQERRSGAADRRQVSQRRISLALGFGEGWLAFESLKEKRRLTPIPENWEHCADSELRSFCTRARLIQKARSRDTNVA